MEMVQILCYYCKKWAEYGRKLLKVWKAVQKYMVKGPCCAVLLWDVQNFGG